jgi:hypothetical protein
MRVFVIGGATLPGERLADGAESASVRAVCRDLGRGIARAGHVAVVCSPFEDSADRHVLSGIADSAPHAPVEAHFPDTPDIRQRMREVVEQLGLSRVSYRPHQPPQGETDEAMRYAWLACQIAALDRAQVTVALGGRPDGAANLLLLVAEARQKPVLPIPALEGAAKHAFYRRQYELQDRLGTDVEALQDPSRSGEFIPLAERLADAALARAGQRTSGNSQPVIFISYPRARPADADYAETVLRRRNLTVFRDEHDLGASYGITDRIREAIHTADIFIALWSREYACSPWCADELELALERHSQHAMQLWILCVDDTRIVPRAARGLVHYRVDDRSGIEARLIALLEALGRHS